MNVPLSVLKTNPAKYFELARTVDIIVTRRGRRLGRVICEERAERLEREGAFDELMHYVKATPSIPDNTVYDAAKEDNLRERGLLK